MLQGYWYSVQFDSVYCVDTVISLDTTIYSHSWTCSGHHTCQEGCQGALCSLFEVSVVGGSTNCGHGVHVLITHDNNKLLGYDYFEITELVIFGRKIGQWKKFC